MRKSPAIANFHSIAIGFFFFVTFLFVAGFLPGTAGFAALVVFLGVGGLGGTNGMP
ncbi:hypothetical protein D3C86_1767830 [compost metagenome]